MWWFEYIDVTYFVLDPSAKDAQSLLEILSGILPMVT